MAPSTSNPFRLNGALCQWRLSPLARLIEACAEYLSGLRQLEAVYAPMADVDSFAGFLRSTLQSLNISHEVNTDSLARIPKQGPTIVVANHPFGIVDGVVVAHLILLIRTDLRMLANEQLRRLPQLRESVIGVDPLGGEGACGRNTKPLREALRWLREGGLLLAFPAGEVSHWRFRQGRSIDGRWSPSIGRLAQLSGATTVPLFVDGANSWVFQSAGLIHPRLRTFLIPREQVLKRGKTVRLQIGAPIPMSRLKQEGGEEQITEFLRRRTDVLRQALRTPSTPSAAKPSTDSAKSLEPEDGRLMAEIEALGNDNLLAVMGDLKVYQAEAIKVTHILREIGRLRELTFREIGEGTNCPYDLDTFDSYYRHLFIWDARAKCIVGAYRLGLADEIMHRFGKKGLYTHSLFKYKRSLLARLNPAIELGRSFVRSECQRSFAPLMLLWKGIGAFVAQNPHYKVLFGPVSISADYRAASRHLLVSYLKANCFENSLARYVKPRRPFRLGLRSRWRDELSGIRGIDELSEFIADLELDGKSVPVLLKQYLKLGGRVLGFNVDTHFNNALDGLIMVDLRETEPKILRRYMGEKQSQRFLDYHCDSERLLKAS